MNRSLSTSVLLVALALQASAQTTRHEVSLGIAPILAFAVDPVGVALADGSEAPLAYAYTTNLENPHLALSIHRPLPDGISLTVSHADGSAPVTIEGPGTVEFVLAGKAAKHDQLLVRVNGTLRSSSVSIPLTLALHDDASGLERTVDRELVLDSAPTN